MQIPQVDIRTILLLLAVGNLIVAGLLSLYRYRQKLPAFVLTARLFHAVGWSLLWLRGMIPDELSYAAGNILLNLGWAIEAVALLSIEQRERRIELLYAALAVAGAAAVVFNQWAQTAPNVRIATASVTTLLFFLLPAFLLGLGRQGSLLQRAIGVLYFACSFAVAFRAYDALTSAPSMNLVTPGVGQTLAFLSVFSLLLFGNIGYLLLLKEKDDAELLQAATSDPLTGLFNRRAFFAAAEIALGLAVRREEPVSLLMFDLDHFKRINDTYGHDAGDVVLKVFAGTTRCLIRPHDIFARIGGEEFVILLIGSFDDAREIAERIRQAASIQVFSEFPELRYTVSAGGFTQIPTDGGDLAEMMRHADRALYKAKNAGRNRVELSMAAPWLDFVAQ
ncbi:GGDEF domain-containing protein [Propionivibrio limicola]|uniref:GGDEF domain-containing protein n=1 Tax=Propionivibrio limicola TaxID=167645 RepID=UPI0012920C6A|nr:GGDEF domain-containing protein [Propionivibrio limicola]